MSIEVDKIVVSFGGVVALQDVSLKLDQGQIVTVIGPNGSGKSTLFNSITGLVKVSSGLVRIDGADMASVPAHRRISRGLARSFQTPRFDPHVTVQDAVLCGFYPVSKGGILGSLLRSPAVARQEREFAQASERILKDFKLDGLRDAALGALPMGQVRLVEVARALAHQPRYLLLDEPAAGLTRREQRLLADEIRRVAAEGVGVLLVEHNFAMVRELSDHAVVLNRGQLLASGKVDELMLDPIFVEAYLGSGQQAKE